MAFHWGSDAVFSIDNAAGTLTDISAYVSDVRMPVERKSAELPRLGKNPIAQLIGQYTASFEVDIHGDETMDAIFGAAIVAASPAAKSAALGPFGTTAGLPKYTAEVYISKYEPNLKADDPGSMTATLLVDADGLTRGTY